VNGSLVRPLKCGERSDTSPKELPDPFPGLECTRTLKRTWVISKETHVLLEKELHQHIQQSIVPHDPDSDLRARITMFGLVQTMYAARFPYQKASGSYLD
jgi:hypothetical protein